MTYVRMLAQKAKLAGVEFGTAMRWIARNSARLDP
jgi:hypothetical protein